MLTLLCNAAVILLDQPHFLGKGLVSSICPLPWGSLSDTSADVTVFTPHFVLGLLFIYTGSFIRLWSYHTMGALFTFEIVLRDNHRLITTGPYGYVRHPSYTGIALILMGVQLTQSGAGSYLSVCGVNASIGMWFVRYTAMMFCALLT